MLRKSQIHVGDSCEEGKNLCPKTFAAACGRRSNIEADETSCFLGSCSSLRDVVYLCILFSVLMLLMAKAFLSEE